MMRPREATDREYRIARELLARARAQGNLLGREVDEDQPASDDQVGPPRDDGT